MIEYTFPTQTITFPFVVYRIEDIIGRKIYLNKRLKGIIKSRTPLSRDQVRVEITYELEAMNVNVNIYIDKIYKLGPTPEILFCDKKDIYLKIVFYWHNEKELR